MCSIFYGLLESAFNKSIPETNSSKNQNKARYPPWFTWDIISDCKLKEKIRSKLGKSPSAYHKDQYVGLRHSLKTRIKVAFNKYQSEAECNLLRNPKNFWKYIKNSKKQNQYPSSFYVENNICSDPQLIADSFASYFSSVFLPLDHSSTLPILDENLDLLGHLDLPDEKVVLKLIDKLPNKMSAGLDGIPCTVVKDCARCFGKPLTKIFRMCLSKGVFPSVWKNAKVCPVFKAGDHTLVSNYRPISMISVFAKVFEMYIYDLLMPYFSSLISISQHGFCTGRSTVTNLLPYTEYVYGGVTSGD